MPIKFRCEHCGQLMGIARRKSGTMVGCPKCKQTVLVPHEDEFDPAKPDPSAALLESKEFDRWIGRPGDRPPSPVTPPVSAAAASPSLPTSRRLEPPLAAESSSEVSWADATAAGPAPRKSVVPAGIFESNVPFALALATTIAALLLGLLLGRYAFPVGEASARSADAPAKEAAAAAPAPPATAVDDAGPKIPVVGAIKRKNGAEQVGDEGATVILLPADQRPVQKLVADGLRPSDQGLPNKEGLEQLRRLGGAFALVDGKGEFAAEVARPGQYFVLVLSKGAARNAGQPVFPDEQSILKVFFADFAALLGDRDFLLITRDLQPGKAQPVRHGF